MALIFLLLHGAARLACAQDPRGLPIGSIAIETHEVFDTSKPPENKLLYRLANRLRRRTRPSVVRRELLFSEGDAYDPALIAETERNLRSLSSIRRAEVVGVANSSGTVDVIVRTYDSWTLEVLTGFKRVGGAQQFKAGLADRNLLGTGKTLSGFYRRGQGASSQGASWKDPYFLRRKLELSLAGEESRDSRFYTASLKRPFYASIVPSALAFTGRYAENPAITVSGDAVTGTVLRRTRELGVEYGIALGTSTRRSRRVTAGLLHHNSEFVRLPGAAAEAVPRDERLGFMKLGADWEALHFIKERRLQKFSREEDYNLGLGVFPSLSWAPRLGGLSTESRILPKLALRKGFYWGPGRLLLLGASYRSVFVNGGNGDRVAGGDAVLFFRGIPRQTLAFHAAYEHGWRLSPASPLTLGEANGLRGYGLSHFSGDRMLVLNVEDRIFIADELWRLVDVGAVAFFDAGTVWPKRGPSRLSEIKSSLGLGLRVAPSRSIGNEPVRIDLAYALGDNRSRSRWSLSILAGHAFGPGSITRTLE